MSGATRLSGQLVLVDRVMLGHVEIENGNGQAAEVLFVPGSRVAMSPYQVMTVDHSGMIVVRGCRKNVTVKLDAANGLPDRQCSKTYVLGQ